MLVKDIFARDVTRDIAPVVYFHEQEPAKLWEEVSEYIITGGYAEDDPRHTRTNQGIHEQFVRLLKAIAQDLEQPSRAGVTLPAAWISGFYGSGKSSFAKLLGLALDDRQMPNGQKLADALLARDDSPKSAEFREVWQKLTKRIEAIAVVFDIGSLARDNEDIHQVAKREIQKRLGYCKTSNYVAEHELKLEIDGRWDTFLECAIATIGKPWEQIKNSELAEEDFSLILHRLEPEKYIEPMSWIDSRAGNRTGLGSAVDDTTKAIAAMLNNRAPSKTLFITIDEVSQYIHQNDNRMLKLQSFVEDLGQKLKGRVWLLATGQQQLEDGIDQGNIGKLKDRFPPRYRVHLTPANIRDVVHKRLLQKSPVHEVELRSLFQQHRSDLKLYAYGCENISEEDFLEVYPLLPNYIDLFMQITSSLRLTSTRVKGDDYAVRGLLQMLGELFRTQNLGDRNLGALVTIDAIYEIQQTALDVDTQNTMTRILSDRQIVDNLITLKVAKAIALLQLIQEAQPTTTKLISQCLYDELGAGNNESEVQIALDKLRDRGHITYSEKLGYKLQSSAGQEWQRERDSSGVTDDQLTALLMEKLKDLVGNSEPPKYKGRSFRWQAYFSDERQRKDERLISPNDAATAIVDLRYIRDDLREDVTIWIAQSGQETYRDRLLWIVGNVVDVPELARRQVRSRQMIGKYQGRFAALSPNKQRLLIEEQSEAERLDASLKEAIANAFVRGTFYFRGRQLDSQGSTFSSLLQRTAESILPEVYTYFQDMAIAPSELEQLFKKQLSGVSPKFMERELGILSLDAGKYVPTCNGEIPTLIYNEIAKNNGMAGNSLLTIFGSAPYGYASDLVRACLLGLLRANKIRIRTENQQMISSYADAGVEDLFKKERDLKKAEILLATESDITVRDRTAICKFFNDHLQVELDREKEAIADAVFKYFPYKASLLRELEGKYNRLPLRLQDVADQNGDDRHQLPDSLQKLQKALTDCCQSRQIEDTVRAVKKHLDTLQDGIQRLGIENSELTNEAITQVKKAHEVYSHCVEQLRGMGKLADLELMAIALRQQLQAERPWRDLASLTPNIEAIATRYREVRRELLDAQYLQLEAVAARVKTRQGFARLSEDKADYVIRPIRQAEIKTTEDALYPTLIQLRDSAVRQLEQAEMEANATLDRLISEETQEQVLTLDVLTDLRNRELRNPEEVNALVDTLRDRLLKQLEHKKNVRIRLI
ncbi:MULTISPECIES: BREX system P-loop protein BrxC [Pseudanabaena]|uniref:BREX system P-loop protein BrxC n=1 Tax=Pseudanabaena TaxID=1152 RepID=UPI00247A23A6|nr:MULTISPECIES: BREX system P-loop protein BrxC [Pseudanabaena]MEA5488843.1 BREX system P-loop protein BrxC [Pseudanabaena sp. CCNP1317]WGS74919.1 BREX system P-loop protein BrxC [Pseudanabaena galeata CCNP1313]